MNDFKLWKASLEVRHPAAALLFDNRGNIATKWQFHDDLTEWRIANNQVTVHNLAKSKLLLSGLRNIIVTEELPKNFRSFSRLASDFSLDVLNLLEVKKIDRLGLRLQFVAERKGFDGLVRKIGRRLYRLEEADWNILGGFPEDIGFPLTLKLGSDKANFKFGPMKKEQYKENGIFGSDNALEKLPLVSIFIDFDLYRLDPSGQSVEKMTSNFIESGRNTIESTVANFSEHFGEF